MNAISRKDSFLTKCKTTALAAAVSVALAGCAVSIPGPSSSGGLSGGGARSDERVQRVRAGRQPQPLHLLMRLRHR